MAAPNNTTTAGWYDIDHETLNLIIHLQQDDIRQFAALDNSENVQGNARGELSDVELAIRLYGEELNNAATVASDRRITSRMRREEGVGYDTVSEPESDGSDDIIEVRPCLACNDMTELARLVEAPCEHEYCLHCLEQLFRNATTDETLYPPRCCRQQIPLEPNQRFLPNDLVTTFREKAVEFSTPNRTYCHQATCSVFIHPDTYVNNVATCRTCRSSTCITCKRQSHDGDCPHDEDLQQVIRLAQEQGWRRCSNCRSMVELNTGCYHITCRCGAQFCYLCGRRWKTCVCVQWDEELLYHRAAVIYNRAPNANVRQVAMRRIQDLAEDLRQNDECNHHTWRSTRGRYYCDMCGDRMRYFVYECQACSTMACRSCRYNRL
ncbi:uncharacterized protein F4812DRAFT_467676 [Daldinia caldariorum]|uniref:uncharacterized protein n=1 Tax=Daldinia caldariorum TaxID=326644 RepID=UPI002007E71A|nr:uncharacterized protein F4812DRAFT_467676 [Daldinia caldariorum]KAI1471700.1 hypothetical protein F4812DRAFT_467676 [Daldinia caldariorum]